MKFNKALKLKSQSEIIEEIIKTANDKHQITTEEFEKIYTFADTKKAVSIYSEEAKQLEEKNYQRLKSYLKRW